MRDDDIWPWFSWYLFFAIATVAIEYFVAVFWYGK